MTAQGAPEAGAWKTVPVEPTPISRAHRIVRTAIKQGKLVRPSACSRCGARPVRASDGRSAIQAHHHDYTKPLDVEWLCAACHRQETPLPAKMGAPVFGAKNGQAKLTDADVVVIRASAFGCNRLARQFNVDPKTIKRIRNGTAWLGVPL